LWLCWQDAAEQLVAQDHPVCKDHKDRKVLWGHKDNRVQPVQWGRKVNAVQPEKMAKMAETDMMAKTAIVGQGDTPAQLGQLVQLVPQAR
jgi:hypothetical protein